jgi:hypothetical protein
MFLSRLREEATASVYAVHSKHQKSITPIHHHPTKEQRIPAALPLISLLFTATRQAHSKATSKGPFMQKFSTRCSRKEHEI